MKNDFFDYLVATDELDDFLGYKEKERNDMGFFDKDDDLEDDLDYVPRHAKLT